MEHVIMDIVNVSGFAMTAMLLILSTLDTALSLRIRIPQGLFMSSKLIEGTVVNYFLAFTPFILDILVGAFYREPDMDKTILHGFVLIYFVFVGMGLVGSIAANYAVAYPKAPFAAKIILKFLPEEIKRKFNLSDEDLKNLLN